SVSGQKSKAKYIIPNDKEESLEEEEEEEEDISFSFCGTSVTDCDHGQCYLRGCTEKGADIVLKTTTGEKFRIEVKILQGISHSSVCEDCDLFICYSTPEEIAKEIKKKTKQKYYCLYIPFPRGSFH
ncbi:hypothetical protein ADUPG1_004833, partial [Aduncisulcus paluster]